MATIHKEIEIERNNEAADAIGEMIQQGLNTMKQTLESSPAGGGGPAF